MWQSGELSPYKTDSREIGAWAEARNQQPEALLSEVLKAEGSGKTQDLKSAISEETTGHQLEITPLESGHLS